MVARSTRTHLQVSVLDRFTALPSTTATSTLPVTALYHSYMATSHVATR
jgi:hypothetical protein